MKDIKKEIADLKARIQELENQIAEPKKWSPVGGCWWIKSEGDVVEFESSKLAQEFGTERPTKEQAERAAIQMRKFNRLLALRDELCGDDESNDTWLYMLIFEELTKKWECITTCKSKIITVYFSTKEHAQRACDMLNSGEVEL